MHEWALAEAIVLTLKNEAVKRGAKVIKNVVVRLGELQNIDIEILDFALKNLISELKDNEGIEIENYKLEKEEARFRCLTCGFEWSLKDVALSEEELEAIHFVPEAVYAYISCPKCHSRDFELVSGRGVYIESIEFGR